MVTKALGSIKRVDDLLIAPLEASDLGGSASDNAKFLRGDMQWANNLNGPITVTGVNMGSSTGVLRATTGAFSADATTAHLPEAGGGVNMYYTNARVASYLTGLTGSSTTSSFLRGDLTWSNALTGGLALSGGLIASPDNAYDIGVSPSNRFRDLFMSRNGMFGGRIGVGVAPTAADGIMINTPVMASGALATGVAVASTLTAAANGDFLVGMNYNPSFVAAGFTNLKAYGVYGAANVTSSGSSYSLVVGVYGMASGGTTNWAGYFNGLLGVLGSVLAVVDNNNDIGASGANRFRDLFLARHATISGGINVGSASGASPGEIRASGGVYLDTNNTFLKGKTSGGSSVNLLALTNDANNITRFLPGVDAGGFQWTNQAAGAQWMALTASALTANGGLNVGSASGASAGTIRASGQIFPGGPAGFNAAFYAISKQYSVAGNTTANIGADLGLSGIAFIRFADAGQIGIVTLPASNTPLVVSNAGGTFVSANPANNTNQIGFYWDGSTYQMKNAYATTMTILIHFLAC